MVVRDICMFTCVSTGRATIRLVDNEENGVLQWNSYLDFVRDSRDWRAKREESEISFSRVAPDTHFPRISRTMLHGGLRHGYDGTGWADRDSRIDRP